MVGRTLGRYKLVEEIGQGGMAVVYRGLDTTLQREVAVKILHPHLSRKEANRVRFAREARVVATLHHDNIVEIYDYSGGDEGDAFIVCEYIRGRTLADFIEKNPPLPVEIAVLMIAEISRALSHAHALGIIHRDIKPENVMIRADGLLKLMDFGIARVQEDSGSTMTGALIGSPAYMSPEQVGGHNVDSRSDLFAVAVILYRLVTGKLPFDAPTPAAVLRAVETLDPEPPARMNSLIPRSLDAAIQRALSKDPAKRQDSVDILAAEALATIADAQLGSPREELKAYFADPARYSAKLKESLTHRYANAGAERKKQGDTAAAMEIWSRVLEMDPANVDVQRWLTQLSRGRDMRKLARTALIGIGALALAGTAGAAAWNNWPERTDTGPNGTPTPTEVAVTETPAPSPIETATATVAIASPTPAKTVTPKAALTPAPTAIAVLTAAPSPTGTIAVAMIPTPRPIPEGHAIIEFDMAESALVYLGHKPGILVGDTFLARGRDGIEIKPQLLEKIVAQCNGVCGLKIAVDRENTDPRLASCLPLEGTAKLVDRRFLLFDKSGERPLREADLYLRGCQTLFRVDVPAAVEKLEEVLVRIDGKDKPLGIAGTTLITTSGIHEISVRAPGFREWKQKIEIRTKPRDDDPFVIKAVLEPSS